MEKLRKHRRLFGIFLALITAASMLIPAGAVQAASKVTPKTVKTTKVTGTAYNKVKIEWKKAANATHYKVYYRKDGASKWVGLATVSNSKTSYTHTGSAAKPIEVGQKYNYMVRGYNSKYKTYSKYNALTVKTVPNTVKLKSAVYDPSSDRVTISWNKAGGCDYYVVYVKKSSGNWGQIGGRVKGNVCSYIDRFPEAGKNTYTVRGYYSKTKVYGKYNSTGISVNVSKPSKPAGIPVTSIDIGGSRSVQLKDKSFTFNVKIKPSNATDKSVVWRCSDPSVASVDSNGVVTLHKSGEVRIDAIASNGRMTFCYVTVYDIEDMIKQAIELTNVERVKAGRAPLKTNPNLQKAAMIRAKEASIKFDHYRPDGRNYGTIYDECGVAHGAGENLGAGHTSAAKAVSSWMNSSGHRATIMTKEYTHIGVGLYIDERGCEYWTQNFTSGNPDDKATITLNTMGGSYIAPMIRPDSTTFHASEIPVPTKPGYTFVGWYRYPENPDHMFVGTKACETMTLYAKWE